MKLAMLRRTIETPAVLLRDGRALDIARAASLGVFDGEVPLSIAPILDPGGACFRAVSALLDRAEAGGLLTDRLVEGGALGPVNDGDLAPPVRPRLILACAMAYKDHLDEMGVEPPKEPSAFVKSPNSVIGPGQKVILPRAEPDLVDFECELTIVFGKRCYNVSKEEALSCVGGYTMVNDLGSRHGAADYIKSLSGTDVAGSANLYHRFIRGKQHPTFCPTGPVVVTADEIPDLNDINIGTRLNGEMMQHANTRDLIFPIHHSIAYFSRWFEFNAGDMLTTGSPSGVGFSRNPPILLQDGDLIEVFSDSIGTLANQVTSHSAAS